MFFQLLQIFTIIKSDIITQNHVPECDSWAYQDGKDNILLHVIKYMKNKLHVNIQDKMRNLLSSTCLWGNKI